MTLLFDKLPRDRPRRVMMKIIDAGMGELGGEHIHYECPKCGDGDWYIMPSISAARRGLPCEKCNNLEN